MNGLVYAGFGWLPEPVKTWCRHSADCSYSEPTQVPLAEKAKVFWRIHFRELGKIARYLRYNGCLLSDKQVAVTSPIGLFNKNVAGC